MTNHRPRVSLRAAALLVALAGVRAAAQDPKLSLIRDDATRAAVSQQLGSAAARGLPTGPLFTKALEGVAKQASSKSIRAAMAALEKRMRAAKSALAPAATDDELAAGADALSVGVSEKTLRELRKAAPGRPIALELGVLTELVARGVPAKKAAKLVLDLMARGATGRQLTDLGSAVQADVAAGLKPEVALDLRGRGIMSLLPPPPSAATLQGRPR